MKTIVKIRELTLMCDEVYGNGVQAVLGLSYVTKMPKHRGMIFYLSEQVSHMVTGNMKFHVDICPIRDGITTDVVQVAKTVIEMNYGLMKEHGIINGDKVEITRVFDRTLEAETY